ncbi:MAG: ABC transporter ATP-binding protein [Lachnospiraceae bacterium]|nr:ABC transporter ATP-binding protein [Lachnospiraceae bacterium]MBD5483060.1 ABC transporter ATP-binding protein [Lachnospiraceae bacterium]
MQNVKTMLVMYRQLMFILTKKQKKQCVLLFLLLIVTATLETLGVSVVIPFILALLSPDELMKNQYIRMVMGWFSIDSYIGMLFLTAFMIIAVYILKNAIIILGNYYQITFRNRIEKDLSVLMLGSYLNRPYTYFLKTNSGEIMRGINNDMVNVATVVDSFSGLVAEVSTCVLIGAMLVYINPFMAIGLVLLAGVTGLGIIMAFKKKTAECGQKTREAFSKRYQYIQQPVNGFKEISVLKKEHFFIDQFQAAAEKACRYNTTYLFIMKMPGRIIETVFIGGLLIMACFNIRGGGDSAGYVAQLGAMAAAAVRILPSVSSITGYINGLVFSRPALESAYNNIKEAKEYVEQSKSDVGFEQRDSDGTAGGNTVDRNLFSYEDSEKAEELQIRDISWKYEGGKANVLEHLSLTIHKGEAVAFVGESGAGKTTLADVILGLFRPQEGSVSYGGKDIFSAPYEWAKMVGYVPQEIFLTDDTVRNNVALGIPEEEIDDEKIWEALQQAQLKEFVEQMEQKLDTVVGERGVKFSGGQRQRIAIARALYYNPQILVLDEATSALDNDTEADVMKAIETLLGRKTMIIIAHRLSTIQNCDKVYEIKNGKAVLREKAN